MNLATADLRKEGPTYVLPLAVVILMATHQIEVEPQGIFLLGELSFDGSLRHAHGILPMVAIGIRQGLKTVIVPSAHAREAALVHGAMVLAPNNLAEVIGHLRGDKVIQRRR